MHREEEYFRGDAMAASVWRGKYALPSEETPDDMHRRLARPFARIEHEYLQQENDLDPALIDELSDYGKQRFVDSRDFSQTEVEEAIYKLFKDFKYIIPQGSIMSILGSDKIGSLSNCFVVGQPHDSYGGILQKDEELVQLMKRRAGVGLDLSSLRYEDASVTNAAGSSTGAPSFMDRYSNSTREVAQKGRRGALMLTIMCNHPDVVKFINAKQDRTKVTGANISVLLTDEFMEAVKDDGDFDLIFDGEVVTTVKAKEIYDQIVHNAWDNAEPGQMFIDRHWDCSPDSVYDKYKGVTTNPCGEIFMGPYDACRLMALNLFSVVKDPFKELASLDEELLYSVAYEQQRLADNLIDLEIEHIYEIINKIHLDPEPDEVKVRELHLWNKVLDTASSSRRTGCGFTALGDMLAALGLKYDSEEAMGFIAKVMKIKMTAELDATVDMAIQRGPFALFHPEKEYYNYHVSEGREGVNSFFQFLNKEFPRQVSKMCKFGRRNVSWSTVAPTGSVSILAKAIKYANLSSGMEPIFKNYYIRRKKVNPGEDGVRVDFVDQNGDNWMEYPIVMGAFKDWLEIKGVEDVELLTEQEMDEWFAKSPWYGACAEDIDWMNRVRIQSIIQKYTSHSISSTINLPKTVTEQEVAEIYLYAYECGLKGVTIYRDGSRSGVLITEKEDDNDKFVTRDAPKRPKVLPCEVHQSVKDGEEFLIIVGLLDGKPYEVFCVDNEYNLPRGVLAGDIIKQSRSNYTVKIPEVIDIERIGDSMSNEEAALSRMISTALRHGADIKFVVEQLNKAEGDLQAFSKVIARNLKKYIKEGEEATGVTCDNCGSTHIIYEEGCQKCADCGTSKC